MLGPGARTKRLLDELREEGVVVHEDDLARIHGPAGLDLGAEGPEEIASAIAAEILAVKRGGPGGPLRDRPGPIHARPARAVSGRT
jgi:xanthine/CO dehydrogenase XdhC/CoxF family maturation factor